MSHAAFLLMVGAMVIAAYLPALLLPVPKNPTARALRVLNAYVCVMTLGYAAMCFFYSHVASVHDLGLLLIVFLAPFCLGIRGQEGSGIPRSVALFLPLLAPWFGYSLHGPGRDGAKGAISILGAYALVAAALMCLNYVTCLPARYVLYRREARRQGHSGRFSAWAWFNLHEALSKVGMPNIVSGIQSTLATAFAPRRIERTQRLTAWPSVTQPPATTVDTANEPQPLGVGRS